VLLRTVTQKHVPVIPGDLAADDRQLPLHGYLPQQVSHPQRHLTYQHLLAVFGYPHQMHLQIVFAMTAPTITLRLSAILDLPFA
jgi:hypothetical protein